MLMNKKKGGGMFDQKYIHIISSPINKVYLEGKTSECRRGQIAPPKVNLAKFLKVRNDFFLWISVGQ